MSHCGAIPEPATIALLWLAALGLVLLTSLSTTPIGGGKVVLMMASRIIVVLVFTVSLLAIGTASARADHIEDWDADANGWANFAGGSDVPLNWIAAGGMGGSGYVSSHLLGTLDTWADMQWPAYVRPEGTSAAVSLTDQQMSISVHDMGNANLDNGTLVFYAAITDGGPNYAYYYYDIPIQVGQGQWSKTTVNLGDLSHWVFLRDKGTPPTFEQVQTNPNEYGFGILNGETVSGQLGFDGFSIQDVPEPSTLILAPLGLLGLIAFGRRRKR